MPICNKPPATSDGNSSTSAAASDDHASEAAKMRRTREQAYFNSYDFDAIEVLHTDEDEEQAADDVGSHRQQLQRLQRRQQQPLQQYKQQHLPPPPTHFRTLPPPALLTASLSLKDNASTSTPATSSRSGSSRSSSSHDDQLKYSYLQRLGAFFGGSQGLVTHERAPSSERSSCTLSTQAVTDVVDAVVGGNGQLEVLNAVELAEKGNFLLPRAMLKYQSAVGVAGVNAISMPLAGNGNATAKILQNVTGSSSNNFSNGNKNINNSNNMFITSNSSSSNTIKTRQSHANHHEIATGLSLTTLGGSNATLVTAKETTKAAATTKAASTLVTTTKAPTTNIKTTTLSAVAPLSPRSSENVASRPVALTAQRTKMAKTSALTGPTATTLGTTTNTTTAAAHGVTRERAGSHQSHYSTDKSGSSGYYSSNVCSTYSIEDHIYCEPVIDVLDLKSKSGAQIANNSNNSSKTINNNGHSQRQKAATMRRDTNASHAHARDTAVNATVTLDSSIDSGRPQLSEHLRILETSIENLDRHLKTLPCLSGGVGGGGGTHQTIAHYVQLQAAPPLPTIMEGFQQSPITTPAAWVHNAAELVDDSLHDIDLNAFLLVNERDSATKTSKSLTPAIKLKSPLVDATSGIDNPAFLDEQSLQLAENNYKCAKYINSCPEDAYRVESDIVAASQKSASMAHFLSRYEDQLHFQSTRELLEDVRDKIRLLSRENASELARDTQPPQHEAASMYLAHDQQLPQELDVMIQTLKRELELYLSRMNAHSELEIRQLCSGLVKNQNIVKMKKAFERRRSIASLSALDSDYDFSAYEALRDGLLVSASGVPLGIRQQITSIRCATSDPNFQMRRKSLTEVFPVADFYVETSANCEAINAVAAAAAATTSRRESRARQLVPTGVATASLESLSVPITTQLQRNLSFQQPILNQLNAQTGGGGGVGVNPSGTSGSGSGGDSGDKDSIMEWHRKKPSIWEMYYGTNRKNQSLLGKRSMIVNTQQAALSYPSSRPESDFTLDLPRAEQLRIKMEKEKKFRQRCRYITSFLSLVFFLLTVMVVSLVLTRGKRMFGSMI